MTDYWQEIATTIIILTALWLLIRKYFIKTKKKTNSEGADACAPCSSSSCDGCAVKDLLNEIDEAKGKKESRNINP